MNPEAIAPLAIALGAVVAQTVGTNVADRIDRAADEISVIVIKRS